LFSLLFLKYASGSVHILLIGLWRGKKKELFSSLVYEVQASSERHENKLSLTPSCVEAYASWFQFLICALQSHKV